MQNTPINFEPAFLAAAAANVLNCAITSLAGPVGLAKLGQPYMLLTHIRLQNKTAAPVTASLYKGATGGSTAGTEFAFPGVSIPANSAVDWYGRARFDSVDFLSGIAGSASAVSVTIEGEVGFATA